MDRVDRADDAIPGVWTPVNELPLDVVFLGLPQIYDVGIEFDNFPVCFDASSKVSEFSREGYQQRRNSALFSSFFIGRGGDHSQEPGSDIGGQYELGGIVS